MGKKGDEEIAGLTDSTTPRRLGPKRANKIRKLFNLGQTEDVRKYVITRKFDNRKGKKIEKRCKIQRLITPVTLQRKKQRQAAEMQALEKSKADAAEYYALVQKRLTEQKEARRSEISK